LTHSVSAGLDYAAIGPEHAYLRDQGRIDYDFATDDEALDGFQKLARIEGIIPALESSHAIAQVLKVAPKMKPDQIIVANLSGRGDKDVAQAAEYLLKYPRWNRHPPLGWLRRGSPSPPNPARRPRCPPPSR